VPWQTVRPGSAELELGRRPVRHRRAAHEIDADTDFRCSLLPITRLPIVWISALVVCFTWSCISVHGWRYQHDLRAPAKLGRHRAHLRIQPRCPREATLSRRGGAGHPGRSETKA